MAKQAFNKAFLDELVKRYNATVLEDYSVVKMNRDTTIKFNCLSCGVEYAKKFRYIKEEGGFHCKGCTNKNASEKAKKTFLENYGVENPMKSVVFKNKIKETCIKKYGVEYALQSNNVKIKKKETYMRNYGVDHPSKNIEIKNKKKETCMKNYGVETPLKSELIKDKIKSTCIEKYGVENPFQSKLIKDKIKSTCIEKYGVENPFQSELIKDKIKNTCIEKYGVEYTVQSKLIKDKIKNTCIEKYGVKSPIQNIIIKNKMKETCVRKYGVEYPLQNPHILDKSIKKSYKYKTYIFPSGKTVNIQGYENFALDILIKDGFDENDIITGTMNVPTILWKDSNDINHIYFPDIYILSLNLIIEVKSTWTVSQKTDLINIKLNSAKASGFNTLLLIFDSKGQLVKKDT